MENNRLNLPTGIQTFEEIRTMGYVYVDKTQYLIDLLKTGQKVNFLARPRRFGKSLTISTLDALFSGKRELFKGLYAEEYLNRPEFEPSPVIRLDMSKVITNHGLVEIEETITEQIRHNADRLGVSFTDSKLSGLLFFRLITNVSLKYSKRVVILIDEYDAPYTDFVNDPEMADKVRNLLRSLYVQIKANDEYIRFVFITGISKFAKLGVFSALNNTTDISLNPKFSEICGYTEEEIIRYFPDYLDETADYMKITTEELIIKMRNFYNGFTFDRDCKTKFYNPFSTLSFFNEKEFDNFWIETGKSKVIADYMKNRNLTVEQFRRFPISKDFARSPGDVDETTPEGFLYQCGYLTLRPGILGSYLSLDYPNTEVLNSMSKLLTKNIVTENDYNYFQGSLLAAIVSNDVENFIDSANYILSCIPYDDFTSAAKQSVKITGNKLTVQEWLYRSCIIAFLRASGIVTFAEVQTNVGRSDIVLTHQGHIWLIEIKVAAKGEDAKKKAEEAYLQIDKNYANAYPEAICVGLAIEDEKRQITEYRAKNL